MWEDNLKEIINSSQPLGMIHARFFIYQTVRALCYMHTSKLAHRDVKPGNLLVNSNCDLSLCDFGLSRRLPVPPDQSTDSAPSESSSNVTQRQAEMTELVQTRWYRGPEVICASKVCPYDEKIDIWGVGCILGEILTRKPLFAGDDHWQQLQYIIEQLGAPPAEEVNEIDPRQSIRDFIHRKSQKAPKETRLQCLQKIIPRAHLSHPLGPLCLDLLSRLLAFSPKRRPTALECLSHPFFEELHQGASVPKGDPASEEEFSFESDGSNTQRILAELIKEVQGQPPQAPVLPILQGHSDMSNSSQNPNAHAPESAPSPIAKGPVPVRSPNASALVSSSSSKKKADGRSNDRSRSQGPEREKDRVPIQGLSPPGLSNEPGDGESRIQYQKGKPKKSKKTAAALKSAEGHARNGIVPARTANSARTAARGRQGGRTKTSRSEFLPQHQPQESKRRDLDIVRL